PRSTLSPSSAASDVYKRQVFTKADKSTQRDAARNAKMFIEAMKKEWEFIPRSFTTSSVKFLGKKDILGYLEELNVEFAEATKEGDS
ncbi:MAG: hypothetical protein IAE95_00600, partial [Chitinophagaceae bacterium]|nr:hypothetical protein [Chitinophagaceae bacterium]